MSDMLQLVDEITQTDRRDLVRPLFKLIDKLKHIGH